MAKRSRRRTRCARVWVLLSSALWLVAIGPSEAQVTTSITATQRPSCDTPVPQPNLSLATTVASNGNTTVITGGTHVGPNLFHSFDTFNVETGAIAQFQNSGAITAPRTPPATISNIFARVIGGRESHIDGTIQTVGFGNASLWFMNPSGIVFGPNATLDIGGSATFTTANSVTLGPSSMFATISNARDVQGLNIADVTSFGFFSDPRPQGTSISIHESNLSVPNGQTLSFVGGEIDIAGGHLRAPNGAVRITSGSRDLSCEEGTCGLVSRDPTTGSHSFALGTRQGTITLSQGRAGVDLVIDTGSRGPIQLNGVIYNGTNATGLNPTGNNSPIIVIKDGSFLVTNLPPTKLVVSSSSDGPNSGPTPKTLGLIVPPGSESPLGVASATNTLKDPSSIQTVTLVPANRLMLVSDRCAGRATGEFSSFVWAGRDTALPQPGGLLASPPRFEDEIPRVSERTVRPNVRADGPFTLAPGTIAFLARTGGCQS